MVDNPDAGSAEVAGVLPAGGGRQRPAREGRHPGDRRTPGGTDRTRPTPSARPRPPPDPTPPAPAAATRDRLRDRLRGRPST